MNRIGGGRAARRRPWSANVAVAIAACLAIACGRASGADTGAVLFFGGDTSHGESYQERYAAEGRGNVVDERGYDGFFEQLRPLWAGADVALLNLETPLTTLREPPYPDKMPCHYSDPKLAAASLKRLGFGVVSLANNHAMDFGQAGLRETLAALNAAGIDSLGAGFGRAAAEAPYTVELADGSIRVAIIGNFERRDWYAPYHFYADGDAPGTNPIDAPRLAEQIAELKRRAPATFAIVTPHWGENYVWRSAEQRSMAERFVAAGADLVIGHGAHCLQEVERIDGRWVFYSIGNLVFNTEGRFEKKRAPRFSLPLRVTLHRSDAGCSGEVRAYPIFSDNLISDYTPRLATPDEADGVRQLLLARDEGGALAANARWQTDAIGPCMVVGFSAGGAHNADGAAEPSDR